MGPVYEALNSGYSTAQILGFLKKLNPKMAKNIQTAVSAGYSGDQILKFLSSAGTDVFRKQAEGYDGKYKPDDAGNLKIQGMRQREEEYRNLPEQKLMRNLPGILGNAALTAAGTYALSRALPAGLQMAQGLLGGGETPPTPITPSPADTSAMNPPIPQQMQAPQQTEPFDLSKVDVSQPENPPEPETEIVDAQSGSLDFAGAVEKLIQSGRSPQQAEAAIREALGPKGVKDLERKVGTSVKDLVARYTKAANRDDLPTAKQVESHNEHMINPIAPADLFTMDGKDKTSISAGANDIKQTIPQPNVKIQEQEYTPLDVKETTRQEEKLTVSPSITGKNAPFKKGQYVFTTTGVYSPILDFDKQGRAIVQDSKGNKKAWKTDKLISAPDKPDVDLDKITLNVQKQLPPKAEISSSNIFGHAYFPEEEGGTAVVRFQNGEVYAYYGVKQEDYDGLASGDATCTTSGENAFGKWWVGKDPSLGAAFHRKMKRKYPYDRLVF